jgi:hypothetical protein
MSFMKFSVHLDTSHDGPHPFKDAGTVADNLTGIHNAIMEWLLIVNRSCILKGLHTSKTKKETELSGF